MQAGQSIGRSAQEQRINCTVVVFFPWYSTWLLIELTPKGVIFSFLVFSFVFIVSLHAQQQLRQFTMQASNDPSEPMLGRLPREERQHLSSASRTDEDVL